MKVVVAPNSFKECLASPEVAAAIARGILASAPGARVVQVPLADGGEGTVRALVAATGGSLRKAQVKGPLGEPVQAEFGILGDGRTAVVEMAAASGLSLVPREKRNPLCTFTYGTGELILAGLDAGCSRMIIGIGGSATVDGGAGMAQALGVQLLDAEGRSIGRGGGALAKLAHIDTAAVDFRIESASFTAACDVDNPLTGPQGAARVYGPQKGATAAMVKKLDANLAHFAAIIKQDLGLDVAELPGAGAAGGLGAGLVAFLNAKLVSGVELVMELVGLADQVMDADLVITGEGRLDSQTGFGKVPAGVARLAKKYGTPVLAVAGSLGEGFAQVHSQGVDAVASIVDAPMPLEKAIGDAERLLAQTAESLMRIFRAGWRAGHRAPPRKPRQDAFRS